MTRVAKSSSVTFTVASRRKSIMYGNDKYDIVPTTIRAGNPFQAKNVATALMTLKTLDSKSDYFETVNLETAIQQGFDDLQKRTRYKGRWQILGQDPLIICDSAHNEGGLRILFDEIKRMKFKDLHFVYGTVSDKDLSKVFPLFPSNATYYFAKANIPLAHFSKRLSGE